MRKVFGLVALALVLATPTPSIAKQSHYHHYGNPSNSDYYTNVSHNRIHRPVRADRAPAGASAHCRDGSWSFSQHHQGTCSHHGGVARFL